MKTKIANMDKTLKEYNSENGQLGFVIDDLRLKQDAMQAEIKNIRNNNRKQEEYIKKFRFDVSHMAGLIQHPNDLKEAFINLWGTFVRRDTKSLEAEHNEIDVERGNQEE